MQIKFIRPWSNLKNLCLDVEASDSIDAILARIAEIDDSRNQQLIGLEWNSTGLKRGKTLWDYSISDGDTVLLRQQFEIDIQPLSGNTFTLEIDTSCDIGAVKCWIWGQEGIDHDCIQLVVGTTVVDDYKKYVLDYGLKQGSRVQAVKVARPGAAA